MIKEKLYILLLHCIGWVVFFSLPVIFIISQPTQGDSIFSQVNPLYLLGFGIYVVIFYLHTCYLFPQLFFRQKRALYFVSLAILFSVVFLWKPYDRLSIHDRGPDSMLLHNRQPLPGGPGDMPFRANPERPIVSFEPPAEGRRPQRIDIISIALFLLVIAMSITLILEKRWRIAVKEAARAEADKAQAELSFLKAQINPHFLFNTLNNIYSLAVTKNEHVADAIMKLSNLMRYVTDDVNEDFVLLERELESIQDYISLQRLRLGKKALIDFSMEGNITGRVIAPLLLMPFVENAFKHGISNATSSVIFIRLTATADSIIFHTENQLFARAPNADRTGIGNTNTKKRLEQIYPGKYNLEIAANNDLFTVHLVMYI